MPITKQKIWIAIAFAVLLAAGCNKPADVAATTSANPAAAAAANTNIVGEYEADPAESLSKTADKKDPAAEMGKAFASMMGKVKLKIDDGDAFALTVMGMKMEGKYTRSGNKITFTTDHVMGMTLDQFKAAQAKSGGTMTVDDSMSQPIEGEVLPSGEIKTMGKGKNASELLFKKAEPEKPVPMTLTTDEEKALVGEWKGTMELPANATDKEKEQFEMMKGMMQALALELRQNGTFKLNVMMQLEGDWKLEDKKLSLSPTLGKDMGGDNKPMVFTVSDDGKTLVLEDDKKGKLTFTKG